MVRRVQHRVAMKTKSTPRLTINKNTLRNLTAKDLATAAGGFDNTDYTTSRKYTCGSGGCP